MPATYSVQGHCNLCDYIGPITKTMESARILQLAHEIAEHLAIGSTVKYYCDTTDSRREGVVTYYDRDGEYVRIDNEPHPVGEIMEVITA